MCGGTGRLNIRPLIGMTIINDQGLTSKERIALVRRNRFQFQGSLSKELLKRESSNCKKARRKLHRRRWETKNQNGLKAWASVNYLVSSVRSAKIGTETCGLVNCWDTFSSVLKTGFLLRFKTFVRGFPIEGGPHFSILHLHLQDCIHNINLTLTPNCILC